MILSDGKNCPTKTTGLFPIQSDCQKFLNCFKGRGYVQSCGPGTLFNPNSLECDFPAKVQCLDGNPSKIDSSFINRNPSQNFDLNVETSNQDQVFISNTNKYQDQPQSTNQYQPSSTNQFQPQSTNQYQPQSINQYQPQSTNQYQPQSKNPLVGTQFIVEGQNFNTDTSQHLGSAVTTDYGLQIGESKPLYGSSLVVNGYTQQNAEVQSQQFYPNEQNHNFAPQNTQVGQEFIPRLPPKSEPANSNTNYPGQIQQQFPNRQNFVQNPPSKPQPINSNTNLFGSNQQQFPIQQNFNQNPPLRLQPFNSNTNYPESAQQQLPIQQNVNRNPPRTNLNGYVNPEQGTIPFSNGQSVVEGNKFLPNPNNYGNVQETQNTYLSEQEQINQQKIKVRFPSPYPYPQNRYNGNQKPVSQNPSNINPNSWIRGQLKGKQGSSLSSNSNTNEQSEYEEFQTPNNQFNKPASTFDLGNRQQIEHNKPNNYDSSREANPTYIDYGQQSPIHNAHGYNSKSSPDYSTHPMVSEHEQPQYLNPIPQDRRTNGDSKMNKQFKIVVPNISKPIDDIQQSKPNTELSYNRDSAGRKLSNNYNGLQFPKQKENIDKIQNPSYTDNIQSPSQESPVYSPSTTNSKCPNGFNGIKPHPTECSKFLSCANGRAFEMDCGPGTLFNPTISVCDHPYNVECNQLVRTTSTTVEEDYFYSTPTTILEDYTPLIDVRQEFDHETSNSDLVTETEPLENHNQAVLETLPSENKQSKILRNPTSIDLADNFLQNSSIMYTPPKIVNNKVNNNVAVRIDLKPNSTQSIRLRGGPKSSEGFLQVQGKPFQWGVVCDELNSWTIEKADIVCKQLGFKRY